MSLLQRDEHNRPLPDQSLIQRFRPGGAQLQDEAGRLNAHAEGTQGETGRKAMIGAAPLDPSRNQVCAILEKESNP
jgi:hypothetical protein